MKIKLTLIVAALFIIGCTKKVESECNHDKFSKWSDVKEINGNWFPPRPAFYQVRYCIECGKSEMKNSG